MKMNYNKNDSSNQYDVFISYRRSTGANDARLLEQALKSKGFSVFFDYSSLRDGKFDERIYAAIKQAPVFILIMSTGCFEKCLGDNDWVRREIEYALSFENKTIIPIAPSDNSCLFPTNLPQSLQELTLIQVSELNKASLFEESINKIIEDRFPKILKEKRTQAQNGEPTSKNRVPLNGLPIKENIDLVSEQYAHFLYAKKGWAEFSVLTFESSNDYLIGYKVYNSNKVPVRLTWLLCSDILELSNLDEEEFSAQAEKVFCKASIAPGQSVDDAWNSLSKAFMPALLFAYDIRGLVYDAKKKSILIPLVNADYQEYKNRADVCLYEYDDGRDCVCVIFNESRLAQLIGKNRAECSELVLGWINGTD